MYASDSVKDLGVHFDSYNKYGSWHPMVVLSLPLFLPDFDSSVICPLRCVMAGVGKAVLQGMALGHLLRGVGVVADWTVCQSQLLCRVFS